MIIKVILFSLSSIRIVMKFCSIKKLEWLKKCNITESVLPKTSYGFLVNFTVWFPSDGID